MFRPMSTFLCSPLSNTYRWHASKDSWLRAKRTQRYIQVSMGTSPLAARSVAVFVLLLQSTAGLGCALNRGAIIRQGDDIENERIVGLYPCTEGARGVLDIDPEKPLTILVHGCSSSGARFKTLAKVFEAHGQQTICFNYNDRDYLNTSATQLARALSSLQIILKPQEITVLGHSQGGLIARRSLQEDLPRPLIPHDGFSFRLVTVSAPFSGIQSSADCGKVWLHALSLSATVFVCMAVTGNKWTEIPPGSKFMTNTATTTISRHLQILTDERGTCRLIRSDGTCQEDDFVFSLDEQRSRIVAADPNATTIVLNQGHAAVVGENGIVPQLLIETLQRQNILGATPPGRPPDFLARLYAPNPSER
jgi:hypothetical protein